MKICVCYLFRGDMNALERFVRSYRSFESGVDFTGFILNKSSVRKWPKWAFNYYSVMNVPNIGRDLASYGYAAKKLREFTHFVFLNSYSEITYSFWLFRLIAPFKLYNNYGLAGATSSNETFRRPYKPYNFLYPKYPNPHIRTNAFAIPRDLMLKVWPSTIHLLTKWQCHNFESGSNGLTRLIEQLGFDTVTVGRNGLYKIGDEDARVFGKDQSNLLVSDNRTRANELNSKYETCD